MRVVRMRRTFEKTGFSLVEVIVASLLLAMITGGVLSVALSSRKIVTRFHLRHSGYEVAQVAIEGFRKYLGYNYWNDTTSPIAANNTWYCHDVSDWSAPLDMAAYFGGSAFAQRNKASWCYKIENVSYHDYRKITVNVTWDEDFPD